MRKVLTAAAAVLAIGGAALSTAADAHPYGGSGGRPADFGHGGGGHGDYGRGDGGRGYGGHADYSRGDYGRGGYGRGYDEHRGYERAGYWGHPVGGFFFVPPPSYFIGADYFGFYDGCHSHWRWDGYAGRYVRVEACY